LTAQSQQLSHQSGTGIFKTAFDDQWTTDMDDPEPEDTSPRTDIMNHVTNICSFSTDSLMVQNTYQQQWSELAHVVMQGFEDSKEFEVFCDDEITIAGKLMLIHQKLFKSFLLFYKWKTLWEDVLDLRRIQGVPYFKGIP
jgi:hypothetical protein